MERFDVDRQKLEAQLIEAAERLIQHMGTAGFVIPLKDGTVVAAGFPEDVIDLVKDTR